MLNRSSGPPNLADKLLKWFCARDLFEGIQGDLHEYYDTLPRKSIYRDIRYWLQVLNFIRPFAIKTIHFNGNPLTLLKLHTLLASRSLKNNKFFTLINVFGLSCGLLSVMYISLYILDEWSYDNHWKDKDRIFRAYTHIIVGDSDFKPAYATAPMSRIFQDDFPEVELSARTHWSPDLTFVLDNKLIKETDVIFADQSIIDMFSLKVIHGNSNDMLISPNTVIVTRTAAMKYYNTLNVVGQELITNNGEILSITGVIEDIPKHSHFSASVIRTTLDDEWHTDKDKTYLAYWTLSAYRTYIKLRHDADPDDLVEKFSKIYPQYFSEATYQFSGQTWDEFKSSGNKYHHYLQPVSDIWLYSNFLNDDVPAGDIMYLYIFGSLGMLILLIAYFNFINLSTARNSEKAKELSIKRALGSSRWQLLHQCMVESILLSLISLFLAFCLSYVMLPLFNEITGKDIVNPLFNEYNIWLYMLSICIIGGLLSGVYPAFMLWKLMLQNTRGTGVHKNHIRSSLVAIQFTVAIVLIVCVMVVNNQLDYMFSQRLGYNKENTLVINNLSNLNADIKLFKSEILSNKNVTSVSNLSNIPADRSFPGSFLYNADSKSGEGKVNARRMWGDRDMFETLGLKLVAGRNFQQYGKADSLSVIVNESAINALNIKDPIGKKIRCTDGNGLQYTIIGVVGNFHLHSLKTTILPLAIHQSDQPDRLAIRYKADDLVEMLDELELIWRDFVPNEVFEFEFLEDRYTRFYKSEQQMGKVISVFVVLAIIISMLGLTGLAIIISYQRRAELSIRKVLGASVINLIYLMNTDMSRPLMASIIVGLPFGYWLMDSWLQEFSYRTNIGLSPLLYAGVLCSVLGLLVISLSVLKTARANPAYNLRGE